MLGNDPFLEEDDIFGGTADKKYFDILFHANRNLVEFYLTANLEKIAIMEHMLEDKLEDGIDMDRFISNFAVNNPEIVSKRVKDLYINDMGSILTQNE